MKRKWTLICLIFLSVAAWLFSRNIGSLAKKNSITLSQNTLNLHLGEKKKLKVNGTSKKIKWSSSDKRIATVSGKGVVRAKKEGKAIITAKVGKWKGKTKIVVMPQEDNNSVNEKIPTELEEIPSNYFTEIKQAGTLVELNYETYESKTYEQKSKKLNKRAIVYLPYKYSEDEKYNVFYLMHGGWSDETTWLGTPQHPAEFKNVIDHAIYDGKMKPFIIVCPTYNNESPSDSSDYTLAYYTLTVNYHNELMNDLIPAVEGKYSTYADDVTSDGIEASRDHRAFGGFSMGSVTTWHTFLNCLDAFRYFLPCSGAVDSTGDMLNRAVTESKYQWNDFFIYAATGTNDFACSEFTNQINGMLNQKSGNFREADNESEGNLVFRVKEGYSHDSNASMEYVYNGMLWFWNKKDNLYTSYFTKNSTVGDIIADVSFKDFGRLLFPVNRTVPEDATLEEISSDDVYVWYSHIQPDKTVEIVNHLKARAEASQEIYFPIYSEEEIRKDSSKADIGLFYFGGNKGEPFAIMNAGGGFMYVGAMHDSFPHALEVSKLGYNTFALIYRPDKPYEDLARAITYLYDHSEELGIKADGYSLWGGSAGARMAATLGNKDYLQELTKRSDVPQAAAVIMQYTGYTDTSNSDAPTYACVGTNDGIASWNVMKNRLERLENMGIATEFHSYKGLEHGFGLGIGTIAEGWIEDAVNFWKIQIK